METTLRPLTLGEILDRTAQLYRTNFLLFAGIASVYAGVLLALGLAQIGVQEYLRARHLNNELLLASVIGALVMWPVIIVAGGLAVAANNRAVAWVHLGQRATIRGAYTSILPRLGRYLWLMAITTFMVWVPFVVIYGGFVVFYFVFLKPKGVLTQPTIQGGPQTLLIFGFVAIVGGILIVAALVYAVMMALRYALAVPACVIEDIEARKAIRRSIELSKGARGRIFLLFLLVIAIEMGLGLVTQGFFFYAVLKYHGALPAWMRALQQVVAFCTNTFVGPIYATGFTLFYYDQRVRKEGFDIEWMMQAAGLGTQASASVAELPEAPALVEPDAGGMPAAETDPGMANE